MSNIIPPLLSNSPPPMIGAVIDDEDDEFGNFAVVNNLSYDDDALSVSTCEEINIKEIPEISHLYKVDEDFQDAITDCVSIDSPDQYDGDDNNIQCNSFQYIPEMPPDISKDQTSTSDFNTPIAVVSDSATSTDSENRVINDLYTTENSTSLPEVIEDEFPEFNDFADFNAFTNTSSTNSDFEKLTNEITVTKEYSVAQDDIEEDDDFGDFNNYSLRSQNLQIDIDGPGPEEAEGIVMVMFPNIRQQAEEFCDENFMLNDSIFCQLKDITDTLALSYQWSKSNCQNYLLQALNIDTRNILYGPRWNESMPRYAATLGFTPLEPLKSETHNTSNGETSSHSELVEQAEIPLAEFDWVGSGLTNPLENSPASTMLLDLEQLVASLDIQYSSNHSPKSQNSPPIDDLDDWEFWLRLTPKKILEKQQTEVGIPDQIKYDKKLDVSIVPLQTNSDTDSIKSLTLIGNTGSDKADDDFDDFSSFQSTSNESDNFNCLHSSKNENENLETWPTLRETQITNINQSNKNDNGHFENWTSLRETHISNSKLDEPSWLKPTILTPDLPRKEVITTANRFQAEEDEFTDFQTGNIESASIPEKKESKVEQQTMPESTIANPSANVVDNIESTTSQPQESFRVIPEPLEPLQPSILQPVKVENAPTTINWPNPGVTDEELHRFDLFFKPSLENTVDDTKLNNKVGDEDDWSDFISNQTAQSSSTQTNTDTPTRRKDPDVQGSKKEQFLVKPPLSFSQNGFPTSFVSNQYVVLNHVPTKTDDVEDEWSDFVSSQPPIESPSRVPKPLIPKLNLDWNGPPQFTSWSTSITPNIITNPVSFESFQSFTPIDSDLFKNRTVNKKNPSVVMQPKKNTVPSISTVPDLEFIAPKNRTWKK